MAKKSFFSRLSNATNKSVIILPHSVGKSVPIHNGRDFVQLLITEDMVNHKLGEFINTRSNIARKESKKKRKKK